MHAGISFVSISYLSYWQNLAINFALFIAESASIFQCRWLLSTVLLNLVQELDQSSGVGT